MSKFPPDNIVLEEEIDVNYEPTEEELLEYATWLGMNLPEESELLWVAREGLKAPLPEHWKPCRSEDDEIYYFNFQSGESVWEHPCDDYYRKLFTEEINKLGLKYQHHSPDSLSPASLPALSDQRNGSSSGVQESAGATGSKGSQTWKQQPSEASLTTRALKGPDTNSLSSSFQPPPRIYPSDGDSSRQNHIPTSGDQGNTPNSSFPGSPMTPRFESNSSLSMGSPRVAVVPGMSMSHGGWSSGIPTVARKKDNTAGQPGAIVQEAAALQGVMTAFQTLPKDHSIGVQVQDRRSVPEVVMSKWTSQPSQREEKSPSAKTPATEDEVQTIHQTRHNLLTRVSQWIQEEERREFDHQRSQMRERVRAKIEEEQRIVLQQERIEMLERAGEAIKEEERGLFDSRHAEMVNQKESGLLVEQPLQVINVDMDRLVDGQKRQEQEICRKQDEEVEQQLQQQIHEDREWRNQDLRQAMVDMRASYETERIFVLEKFRNNLQAEEDLMKETERQEMIQRVTNRIASEEQILFEEMKRDTVKRVKDSFVILEKLMFEEATRALVTTVRESTQARWQELEEKLKQEMECEIAVQQQAFLKEKRKEMVKQMQEVVQTEGWREQMEREIMRTALVKFTEELEVSNLSFRNMLRDEMVRLVTEVLLTDTSKEIESLKHGQLTHMLQKLREEETKVWTDLFKGLVGKAICDREVATGENLHAIVPIGNFLPGNPTYSSMDLCRHGSSLTSTSETNRANQNLSEQLTSHLVLEEVQKMCTGHLMQQPWCELPHAISASTSADLEPDKQEELARQTWTGGLAHTEKIAECPELREKLKGKEKVALMEGHQLARDQLKVKKFCKMSHFQEISGSLLQKVSSILHLQGRSCAGDIPAQRKQSTRQEIKISRCMQGHASNERFEQAWERSSRRARSMEERRESNWGNTKMKKGEYLCGDGMEIEQLLFALELEEGEVFKMSSNTLHGKMSTEPCKLRESGGKIG
ncbi:hypothetical protein CY35_07G075800 [Sphagnum magellanicum]|uniref:Uncharacterized protein n=1 Tax=Sphagnum magellanicum TaxID=128215 RepID=A0ACB8HM03_9BRYO|nr:hypothetical protein CY35_07G075800 [Sphagnum magellanicum]